MKSKNAKRLFKHFQKMNPLKTIFFSVALIIHVSAIAQSTKEVKLVFHAVVGNQPLLLDSNYVSPLGDTFSVTKFKFFISHIALTNIEGTLKRIPANYFLIDEYDSLNQTIPLQVRNSTFTNLEFFIGVDSLKNVSGVQSDALDPATGMFWTWNSGYIMAKLEGKSPQSKAPFGNITYHIGGFRQKDNVIRKISFPLTQSLAENKSSSALTIDINVDLNKWFDGPHPIKIAEESFCMSPGKMAMEIADNYATMFSIKSISIK